MAEFPMNMKKRELMELARSCQPAGSGIGTCIVSYVTGRSCEQPAVADFYLCVEHKKIFDSILLCRFCEDYEAPPTKGGKPNWTALKQHIKDMHKDAAKKIEEHAFKKKQPENLAHGQPPSFHNASLGREFRREMGYSPGSSGAEQKKDDDDE